MGWLEEHQVDVVAAVQAVLAVLVVFDLVDWSETQVAALLAVTTAVLALFTRRQTVSTRALERLSDG